MLTFAEIFTIEEELLKGNFKETAISFASTIIDELRNANATLAIAESCTGGLVGDLITNVPGSSDVFGLGIVAYNNKFKEKILGISKDVLATYGAVSQTCVEEMAKGIRNLADATFGVAISGIAGPSGGTEEKPVGTVHFAVATLDGVWHLKKVFPYERQRVKMASAYVALWLLRCCLLREVAQ